MQDKRFHSVRLDKEKCKGCTNCLKRCPTEAIRVRGGRAHIIDERCIDCGECIKVCPHHAKVALTDPIDIIKNFKYAIALPAPTLYAQFQGVHKPEPIIAALLRLGFDELSVSPGSLLTIRDTIRHSTLSKPAEKPVPT